MNWISFLELNFCFVERVLAFSRLHIIYRSQRVSLTFIISIVLIDSYPPYFSITIKIFGHTTDALSKFHVYDGSDENAATSLARDIKDIDLRKPLGNSSR